MFGQRNLVLWRNKLLFIHDPGRNTAESTQGLIRRKEDPCDPQFFVNLDDFIPGLQLFHRKLVPYGGE